jgi:hypothetical protein
MNKMKIDGVLLQQSQSELIIGEVDSVCCYHIWMFGFIFYLNKEYLARVLCVEQY